MSNTFPNHTVLVIGGDIDAQTSKDGDDKYFLHYSWNKIGEYLAGVLAENRVAYLNTKFLKEM